MTSNFQSDLKSLCLFYFFFDKIFKGDNHSLFIRDVQPDDAGNYSVRAGQVTSEAKLTVEARKFTPKFLKNKFLNFAFTLSIICYEIFGRKVSKNVTRNITDKTGHQLYQ